MNKMNNQISDNKAKQNGVPAGIPDDEDNALVRTFNCIVPPAPSQNMEFEEQNQGQIVRQGCTVISPPDLNQNMGHEQPNSNQGQTERRGYTGISRPDM